MTTTHILLAATLLALAACDSSTDAKADPAKAPAKGDAKAKGTDAKGTDAKGTDAKGAPAKAEPAKAPEPAKPVDPSTFVPADLSVVPALAKYTVNGPAGATVTAGEPAFGETESSTAIVEKDGFKLRVWIGTIGGERTGMPIRAKGTNSKYAEIANEAEKGLLDYSYEKDGKTTLGHITAKFSTLKGSVLCGNVDPVADAAALDPYKKACATLAEKK